MIDSTSVELVGSTNTERVSLLTCDWLTCPIDSESTDVLVGMSDEDVLLNMSAEDVLVDMPGEDVLIDTLGEAMEVVCKSVT